MDGPTYALALAAGLRRAARLYAVEAAYWITAGVPRPGRYRGRRRVHRGHMSTAEMVRSQAAAAAAGVEAIRQATAENRRVPAQLRAFFAEELEMVT